MLKRFQDWPSRLNEFFRISVDREFKWGEHDCCLFACDAILALTGVDPGKEFRGIYTTEAGAFRLMKKKCGGGLKEMATKVAAVVGLEEIPLKFAQRGDVALIKTETGYSLGVVGLNGQHVMALSPVGISWIPLLSHGMKAWRV